MCTLSQVNLGGKIPNSYYLKGRQVLSKNMENREISRGSTLEMHYHISRPGSLIRYGFIIETFHFINTKHLKTIKAQHSQQNRYPFKNFPPQDPINLF